MPIMSLLWSLNQILYFFQEATLIKYLIRTYFGWFFILVLLYRWSKIETSAALVSTYTSESDLHYLHWNNKPIETFFFKKLYRQINLYTLKNVEQGFYNPKFQSEAGVPFHIVQVILLSMAEETYNCDMSLFFLLSNQV